MWGNLNNNYNQLSMGYNSNNDISRMYGPNHAGFQGNRVMGYAESHDEERLMYKNVLYGNSSGSYNVKTLNTALSRMSAIGAVSLLIPGPKMIWHFGELGWESSIFTCTDGSVNDSSGTNGDCKLSTKPQPQWTNNWLGDNSRNKIYYDWARMIDLKTTEAVFSGTATIPVAVTLTPNIKITNPSLTSSDLKDVLIIANFDVTAKNVATGFQYTGSWYNLMDNSPYTVTDVNATISLQPGEFRIYGNKATVLATTDFEIMKDIFISPNPTSSYFSLDTDTAKVEIYAITGQLIKTFNKPHSKDFQYSVSDLNNGLYFVKMYNEDNQTKVLKFIKQ
jgi:hypothetical protein